MRRVIEKGNLAFNEMINICDLCKRCKGFRKSNDDLYDCKYNTNNKGLGSGLVRNHMENYKCKYFKRHQKYHTCRLLCKNYTIFHAGTTKEITYKQGKFYINEVK